MYAFCRLISISHFKSGGDSMRFLSFFAVLSLAIVGACTLGGSDSQTKIVGGQATQDFPEVQMMLTDKSGLETCTGVVVSDSTVLLAAHCIKDGTLHLGIRASGTQVDTVGIYLWNRIINRKYLTPQEAARDLAVAVFPQGTFKAPYAQVELETPSAATSVDLVGFGATKFGRPVETNGDGTLGQKNFGSNQIAAVKQGLITIEAELGSDGQPIGGAVAASGDSGSPLFLSGTKKIVGICAAVGALDQEGQLLPLNGEGDLNLQQAGAIRNLYVDMTSPSSRRLMALAVYHGAQIPGVEKPATSGLLAEDVQWMRRDQPGYVGESSYRAIFFNLIFGGANAIQTTPQTSNSLFGLMTNLRQGNVTQFGGLFPQIKTGTGSPISLLNNRPLGTPPAVIQPANKVNFGTSGIFNTAARPAVPAVSTTPRPTVTPTTTTSSTTTTPTTTSGTTSVPAATVAQQSVDKTNNPTPASRDLAVEAQAFYDGVSDSSKNQISDSASYTDAQREVYQAGHAANEKVVMEQDAEAFFQGVEAAQKGEITFDAARTDSQTEMYNLGWDTQQQ